MNLLDCRMEAARRNWSRDQARVSPVLAAAEHNIHFESFRKSFWGCVLYAVHVHVEPAGDIGSSHVGSCSSPSKLAGLGAHRFDGRRNLSGRDSGTRAIWKDSIVSSNLKLFQACDNDTLIWVLHHFWCGKPQKMSFSSNSMSFGAVTNIAQEFWTWMDMIWKHSSVQPGPQCTSTTNYCHDDNATHTVLLLAPTLSVVCLSG